MSDVLQDLPAFVAESEPWFRSALRTLVEQPTVSPGVDDPKAILAGIDVARQLLSEAGAEIDVVPSGGTPAIIARAVSSDTRQRMRFRRRSRRRHGASRGPRRALRARFLTRSISVRIDVITIFPAMVRDFAAASLLGKAQERGLLDLRVHDPRDVTTDVHRTVDDAPFGGGAGMVLTPGPLFDIVEREQPPRPLFLLGPGGRTLDQPLARELAALDGFSLLCGRYEGVDDRVRSHLVDGEISIGDVVLAGGEVAAMVVLEAVGRLVPGVMGNDTSADEESFSDGLLEHPQYTRPAQFRDWDVPDVLRSGDHARVARWRRATALRRTMDHRPDLIDARGGLSDEDRRVLVEFSMLRPDDERPPDADR